MSQNSPNGRSDGSGGSSADKVPLISPSETGESYEKSPGNTEWKWSAILAKQFNELEPTRGDTNTAVDYGALAVSHADRVADPEMSTMMGTTLVRTRLLRGDAVKKAFAAQEEFSIDERRGGAEGVFELVYGEGRVLPIVRQNHSSAIARSHVNAAGGTDGR